RVARSRGRASGRSVATSRRSCPRSSRDRRAMDDAIPAFLEYLTVERGASAHTLRGYAADLREFSAFLRGGGQRAAAVDMRAIRASLASLHRRGLARTSIGRKLAAVRSYFRFLARRGLIEQNPARLVRSPRPPQRLPSF